MASIRELGQIIREKENSITNPHAFNEVLQTIWEDPNFGYMYVNITSCLDTPYRKTVSRNGVRGKEVPESMRRAGLGRFKGYIPIEHMKFFFQADIYFDEDQNASRTNGLLIRRHLRPTIYTDTLVFPQNRSLVVEVNTNRDEQSIHYERHAITDDGIITFMRPGSHPVPGDLARKIPTDALKFIRSLQR